MTTLSKAGRYELLDELGRGAMGVVYRAHDPVIGRTVAVKTLKLTEAGTGMTHAELIQRFQTEAHAAGLLTHPNIVVVFDAGEEEGLFYITMELVEGTSLQSLLDARQSFPLARVLRIMEQTCSALEFAHQRNVVHRDIKPGNLMLTADDTVKITDFGTAKILQFGTAHTAHVIGTPSYMSPEQVKGKPVDGRSDIFALGVILYELVTGEKPFPGQNITTVIYKIVNEDPIPPRELDSSVHPGLSNVITRALAKEPGARYQSCRELMDALHNYREMPSSPEATVVMAAQAPPPKASSAATIAIRPPTAAPAHPPATPVRATSATVIPPAKPKTGSSILVALVLIAIIAGATYRVWPYMREVWQRGRAGRPVASQTVPPSAPESQQVTLPAEDNPAEMKSAAPPATAQPAAPKSPAGEFTARIEQILAKAGLAQKVHIRAAGNMLTLSGKITPSQHRDLLSHLRNAPPSVRVIDHIEYAADSGKDSEDTHKPMAGRGELDVFTDVLGASAVLHDSRGHSVSECKTPCRFHDLEPANYTIQVNQPGYQPQQHSFEVRSGVILEERLELKALPTTLTVSTRPPQAFIFINGDRQAEQTPATLHLAPGSYDVSVRKPGFEPYFGVVQIKPNEPAQLNIDLAARPGASGGNGGRDLGLRANGGQFNGRAAAATASKNTDAGSTPPSTASATGGAASNSGAPAGPPGVYVTTTPPGAMIMVDGFSIRQRTPALLPLSPGEHTIALSMRGYTVARRTIMVEAGQSIQVDVTLH